MNKYFFATILIVVLTVATGVLQGMMSNRWGPSNAMREAGERLGNIPTKFAAWEMASSGQLEQEAQDQLECTGYIQRAYVNRESGDQISVVVLVGPTAPIAIHTPEICFGSQDNQLLGPRRKTNIRTSTGEEQTFWKASFRTKGIDSQLVAVYYAWTAGDRWTAPEYPRFSFATQPYLYKIQLVCNVLEGNAIDNAGTRFLADFVPVLQKHLQSPTPTK
jgi:hypothetical protein